MVAEIERDTRITDIRSLLQSRFGLSLTIEQIHYVLNFTAWQLEQEDQQQQNYLSAANQALQPHSGAERLERVNVSNIELHPELYSFLVVEYNEGANIFVLQGLAKHKLGVEIDVQDIERVLEHANGFGQVKFSPQMKAGCVVI